MNMSLVRIAVLASIALLVSACTGMSMNENNSADTQGKSDFDQIYQDAENAVKKAASVDNLWSETEDRMKEAKEAATKSDFETAIKLANRAKFESEAAVEQYESQKNAGPVMF